MTSAIPLLKTICAVRRKRISKSETLRCNGAGHSGDVMVSTGILKTGTAIRGPVNRVNKPENFLKRNDNNRELLAA